MVLITEAMSNYLLFLLKKLKLLKTSVHQSIENSRNVNIVSRPWNNSSCCATIKMETLEDFNLEK